MPPTKDRTMPRFVALLSALLLVVTACGSDQDLDATDVDSLAATIDPLPAPTDDVVLTIKGATRPNVSNHVEADIAGIESLGTETVQVDEPFVNERIEFTGVRVDDLFAAAGVDLDATLVWTALDDYQVNFTGGQAAAENAILATRIDGEPIDLIDGGPVRVVFTDPDGELGRDTNQWIWSLHLIEVR